MCERLCRRSIFWVHHILLVVLALSFAGRAFAQFQILTPRPENESTESHYGSDVAFFGQDLVVADLHDYRTDGYDVYRFSEDMWTRYRQIPEFVDGHIVSPELESSGSLLAMLVGRRDRGIAAFSAEDSSRVTITPIPRELIVADQINDFADSLLVVSTPPGWGDPAYRKGYGVLRLEDSSFVFEDFIEETVYWRAACISGSTVHIGVPSFSGGRVNVYRRTDERWRLTAQISSPKDRDSSFGRRLSCWKDRVAVLSGRYVFVFRWAEGSPTLELTIDLPRGATTMSVEMHDEFLAVGYTLETDFFVGRPQDRSEVALYRRDDLGWRRVRAALRAGREPDDSGYFDDGYFGETIAINDEFIAIAAPTMPGVYEWDGDSYTGFHFGEVHVFSLRNLDLIGPRPLPATRQPELAQSHVFPNPVTANAQIVIRLPVAAQVRLTVYDAVGRLVASLADGPYEAGEHFINIDATDWPSGIYVVRGSANRLLVSMSTFVVL